MPKTIKKSTKSKLSKTQKKKRKVNKLLIVPVLLLLVVGIYVYKNQNKTKDEEDYIGTIYSELRNSPDGCTNICEGKKKKLACRGKLWDEGIKSLFNNTYEECTYKCDGTVKRLNTETGEICPELSLEEEIGF